MAYLLFEPDNVDRTPPWHPFKLNSNLTLESLVEDGYRFASMPCGQVQYTKQIGDTIIQYEIEIDCEARTEQDYEGIYAIEDEEDLIIIDSTATPDSTRTSDLESLQPEPLENIYYPWDINEIANCYQNVRWRVFTINLGSSIDSSWVRNYIYYKGGHIIDGLGNWDTKHGGSLLVQGDYLSNLYFVCHLSEEYNDLEDETNWQFTIYRHIPFLDQNATNEEKAWRDKKWKQFGF